MTDARLTLWSRHIALRFTVVFGAGIAALMLLLWTVIMNDVPQPEWFPQEGVLLFIAGALWAAIAAQMTGLSGWSNVLMAGIIAAVLHFLVYFGPLLILLNTPFSPILVFELFEFLGYLVLGYLLTLGAFTFIRSHIARSKKGSI